MFDGAYSERLTVGVGRKLGCVMSRSCVVLRDAVPEDAADLVALWADYLPRSMAPEDDMRLVIKRAEEAAGDRIVVATYEGAFAGAVYLQVAPRSVVDPEPVLNLLLTGVVPTFQRHGIGHALMEAGVQQAEVAGIAQVRSASANNSRSAHRFMARLALSPVAMLRTAPTHVVRAKLAAQRPRTPGAPRPSLSAVLAQRRSQRRQLESS